MIRPLSGMLSKGFAEQPHHSAIYVQHHPLCVIACLKVLRSYTTGALFFLMQCRTGELVLLCVKTPSGCLVIKLCMLGRRVTVISNMIR